MTAGAGRAAAEWRTGWPLVLTCLIGTACTGAHLYPLGVMMQPLQAAHGWSRAEISTAATIGSMCTLLCSFGVGLLLDRFGPRRVALVGAPMAGITTALVAFAGPTIWSWYALWTLYALSIMLILPMVWGAAIARGFEASRGLALAIGLSGAGVASVVYPAITLFLLETLGLRAVYPGIALITLIVLCPMVWFLFRPRATATPSVAATAAVADGLSLPQTIRAGLFWRIVLTVAISGVAASAVNVHFQPLLRDAGLTPVQAVSCASVLGLSVIAGRWGGGLLLDHFHARWVASGMFALSALGVGLLLNFDGSYPRALLAAALIGLSIGGEGDLLPFLLSRYFGLRSFGSIYGLGIAAFGAGYATGPLAAGLLFDRFGNYSAGLTGAVTALCAVALVALTFGPYPKGPSASAVSPGGDTGPAHPCTHP